MDTAALLALSALTLTIGCDPVSLGGNLPDVGAGGSGASASAGPSSGTGASTASSTGTTGGDATGGASTGGASPGGSSAGGASTGGGAACDPIVVGNLTEIAAGALHPRGIVLDATHAYWVAEDDYHDTSGKVMRAALATWVPEELASAASHPTLPADAFHRPESIAIDATQLVWNADCGAEVHRMPLSGGAAQTLYDDDAFPSGELITDDLSGGVPSCWIPSLSGGWPLLAPVRTIALDAGSAYWMQTVSSGLGNAYVGVMRAPLTGGGAQLLTPFYDVMNLNDDVGIGLVLDGQDIFYNGSDIQGFGGYAFEVTTAGQGWGSAPLGGRRLITDATWLYGSDGGNGAPHRIPKAGGAIESLDGSWKPSQPWTGVQDMAEHGDSLYLTANSFALDCGLVVRVPKDGSLATILWRGAGVPAGIAADASGVYWTDAEQGKVMVLAP